MEIITSLILSTIAGLSTCIGIIFTYYKPKNLNKFLTISLSFAAGVMFLISIRELIPQPALFILKTNKITYALLILLICPLINLIIIILSKTQSKHQNKLYEVGVLNTITLLLHNIPEGIVTFISSVTNKTIGLKLTLAIMAHNIPEGICIALPIYFSTNNRKKAFLYTLISGFAEPFGAVLTYLILKNYINQMFLNIMLYYIGTLMILITIMEIIPEVIKYKQKLAIILGLSMSLFILFI